uniref:Replication factor C subunit 2 n=2 Tax=Hirondellea gigas TaxID=1518452 RepID=A0A6A7FVZ4_9CRUS
MHAFLKTGKLGSGAAAGGSSMANKPDALQKKAPKPWVEKYRPKKVSDVVEQEEVVAVLAKAMKGADLPNLLFYGPPGTGKTSTILAMARELYGNELFHQRVLELNASDERGIQVVREKVKNFAQNSVSSTRLDGSPCPPFKLIILDEADSMTYAAQAALRRTMEKQSRTTRFCLICNYVSRIIEPLTSRCAKFRFRPLGAGVVLERLRSISEAESVNISPDALSALVTISDGDLRRAITTLQSVARLQPGKELTTQHIYDTTGVVPDSWLSGLLDACSTGSYEKLAAYVDDLMAEGFAGAQMLLQVHDLVLDEVRFTDLQKAEICEKIAVCDHRLLEGGDEYLQVIDLCCCIMQHLTH